MVLVIHEIFGLTDWAKNLADELAAAGYIAIVPDLLSAPGKDTSSYPDQGAAIKAISALPAAQVFADLDAAAEYAAELPAGNGSLAVTGFCWGGGKAFAYANHNPKFKAAFVFYGPGPENAADAKGIACPVYGFYGEDDARIDATIPKTKEIMQGRAKHYEPVIYPGAGHGFMRAGEAPDASEANRKAHDSAWERWKALLKKLLRGAPRFRRQGGSVVAAGITRRLGPVRYAAARRGRDYISIRGFQSAASRIDQGERASQAG